MRLPGSLAAWILRAMPVAKSRALAIAGRSVLLAGLLLASPIPIVRLGTHLAEKRTAAGDLDGAERLLSFVGAFSTYPLLPRLVAGRIHGARCELSAAKGLDRDAIKHFTRELSTVAGRDPKAGAATGPAMKEDEDSALRFRKGFDAWSRGYAGWMGNSPQVMPDFDRAFLPPAPETFGGETTKSGTETVSASAEPDASGPLRELFRRAANGEGLGEIAGFLAAHDDRLMEARRLGDGSGPVGGGPEGIAEACDGFRLLVLDFLQSYQNDNGEGVLQSLARCGRLLERIETEPSLAVLLASLALRTQWIGAVETAVEGGPLDSPTRLGLVRELTRYRSDPEFPSLCFRFEYAFLRRIYVDSYLGGSWETASAAGRRLFVRQLELAFDRYKALAEAVSPGADPGVSEGTFRALDESVKLSPRIRALRKRFVTSFYGSGELTEADGRDFAAAIEEWIVFFNDAAAIPGLGRLDDSLRELREREDRLISRSEPPL